MSDALAGVWKSPTRSPQEDGGLLHNKNSIFDVRMHINVIVLLKICHNS